MSNHSKVLSIGSYNVGLTCRTGRVPSWGETIIGSGFFESYGGKGSNQAVAAAKLGGDVTFVGCIGNDKYGDDGLDMLNDLNINTSHVLRSDDRSTGVGIILLNDDNDNCIIVDLGANNELNPAYMEELKSVIADADVVIFQLEIPTETVIRGMNIAKRLGKTIIFNPAPANAEAVKLLPYATIVNPNESELLILSGESSDKELTEEQTVHLARQLLEKGPEAIIVTRGEKDCLLVTAEKTVIVPSISVQAEDTTGAGDTFTGALALALTEGKELEDATRFASYAGAYCVTKKEVVPAIPTREELNQFITQKNNV